MDLWIWIPLLVLYLLPLIGTYLIGGFLTWHDVTKKKKDVTINDLVIPYGVALIPFVNWLIFVAGIRMLNDDFGIGEIIVFRAKR